MCNLYSEVKNRLAVLDQFGIGDNRGTAFEPLPAIFPGYDAPIVRRAEDGARELVTMSWGFVLPQQGRAAKRVTNARDEKVLSSRFWRSSFEQRRCLVPVTSFAEPKGKAPAIWHWFALKGDDPRPLFAFAGLWRSWNGPLKPDGEPVRIETYAFLTTTPNEIVKPIHPNRMPVILGDKEAWDTWLEGSDDDAFALARAYPAEAMHIVHRGEKKDAA